MTTITSKAGCAMLLVTTMASSVGIDVILTLISSPEFTVEANLLTPSIKVVNLLLMSESILLVNDVCGKSTNG